MQIREAGERHQTVRLEIHRVTVCGEWRWVVHAASMVQELQVPSSRFSRDSREKLVFDISRNTRPPERDQVKIALFGLRNQPSAVGEYGADQIPRCS